MKFLCCNELTNNVDLWVLMLTAINTVAVVIIAGVQICMERQQMKMQRQDTYKQQYVLIKRIHRETNRLLHDVVSIWSGSLPGIYGVEYLKARRKAMYELATQFSEEEDELRLKVNITNKQYVYYTMLLISGQNVLNLAIDILNNESVHLLINVDNNKLDDEGRVSLILDNLYEDDKIGAKKILNIYMDSRNKVAEHSLLEVLEKHCK